MTLCPYHGEENCAICRVSGVYVPQMQARVNGALVYPRIPVVYDGTTKVHRLRPEHFDAHECDIMKACREAGEDARKLGYRLDVLHEIDTRPDNPEDYIYRLHGRTEPEGRARNMRISGIPWLGMQEGLIDAILRVITTGEPVYDLLHYDIEKAYRRLLLPVTDQRGYVVGVLSCICIEPSQSIAA